jgi:hypothetical protein
MWTFLLALLLALPIGVAVAVAIGIVIFLHPDHTKKWVATIAWIVSVFYKKAEYLAIKWEIEGDLNVFVNRLESNIIREFPRVSIEWSATEDSENVVWEENRVILVMHDRKHKSKNVVHAALLFTSKTLLQNTSFHISKTQKRSMELFATLKILEQERSGVVPQFMADYFAPQVQSDEALKELIRQYTVIERIGAFFPILIQEIHCLGNKVFLEETKKEKTIAEVKGLVEFLIEFTEREVGDTKTPTTFVGDFMRCAIRVVASRAVRERGDVEKHRDDIDGLLQRSLENVYLIGSDQNMNRKFVDDVVSGVLQDFERVQLRKTYRFRGKIKIGGAWREVGTYLVHLHNPDAEDYLFTKDKLEKENARP